MDRTATPMQSDPPELDGTPCPSTDGAVPGDEQNLLVATVQATSVAMAVVDPWKPDAPVVFCNDAFLRLTGYARHQVLGRNCRFLQGRDTDPDTVTQIRHALAGGSGVSVELLNYRRDGTAFWNELSIAPVFAGDGRLLYFTASQLDVTRRREAEEALQQAQKMEAVGQLTGGLAHDFNNLLAVVVGQVEIALVRTENERARVALHRALEATERGSRLTQQLLAFARKQRPEGRPINLNSLVTSLTELLERTLGRDIAICTRLATDLPACRIDPVQAEAALLNILVNARDAMPGGGQVTITTFAHAVTPDEATATGLEPGLHAVVSVTDTGIGMPAAVLARATEPFFTTKATGRGSGMGLAMVHGFARRSHGTLTINSRSGDGTTVRLTFPVVPTDPATPAIRQAPAPAGTGGTETVLVVEDDPDVLALAGEALAMLGYRVLTAAAAADALAVLRRDEAVDLLFTDVVMPGGVDGIGLAREARRMRPGIAVLLTSGLTDPAGPAGEAEWLAKPYRRSVLAARVREVLDRRAPGPSTGAERMG